MFGLHFSIYYRAFPEFNHSETHKLAGQLSSKLKQLSKPIDRETRSDKKKSDQKIRSKDSDQSEKSVTPEMKTKCASKVGSVNKEKY